MLYSIPIIGSIYQNIVTFATVMNLVHFIVDLSYFQCLSSCFTSISYSTLLIPLSTIVVDSEMMSLCLANIRIRIEDALTRLKDFFVILICSCLFNDKAPLAYQVHLEPFLASCDKIMHLCWARAVLQQLSAISLLTLNLYFTKHLLI